MNFVYIIQGPPSMTKCFRGLFGYFGAALRMTDLSVRMSHGELWPFLTFQQKILVENSSVVFLRFFFFNEGSEQS